VAPLLDPPALLARGGSAAHAPAGSPEALSLAMRLGADGVLVEVRPGAGGAAVAQPRRVLRRGQPEVGVEEVWDAVGAAALVAVVVTDDGTAEEVLTVARRRGAIEHLWMCSPSLELLGALRPLTPATRLLHVEGSGRAEHGPERRAARLREMGVDGALVQEGATSAGLSALYHRFGRLLVADGADQARQVDRALRNGLDGVVGPDAEVLADARAERA
jgi:hypothetical protein